MTDHMSTTREYPEAARASMAPCAPPLVVVVTGATSGVGRATARAFADMGAAIGLLARGTDGLEATHAEVESRGASAVAIPTDVADPEAVESAAEAVAQRFDRVDVWVNNAMASVFSPVHEITARELQIADAVAIARELNLDRIASNQPIYNMLVRYIERDIIPLCEREGIGQR